MSEHDRLCTPYEESLALLALGVLTGHERAEALAHVESCALCSADLEQLAGAADSLLEVVPEVEPPVGFEVRVFERLGLSSRRRRVALPRLATMAAAVVLAAGLGVAVGRVSVPGSTKTPHVSTSASAGSRTAELLVAGRSRGDVLLYGGNPGWILMALNDSLGNQEVTCVITTTSGQRYTVGTYWIRDGNGQWASALPVPARSVRSASLLSTTGSTIASAQFST